jgi:hypothetical protein
MTIGKRLYKNFGIILSMVVVLFIVNLVAVQREHAAKDAARASLELADATNQVRFQMMQNRLYLSNYLLSGDTREVELMSAPTPIRKRRRWTRSGNWNKPGAKSSPSLWSRNAGTSIRATRQLPNCRFITFRKTLPPG